MTYTAVFVLLSWAAKATIEQQQEMAKGIEALYQDRKVVIDSYDINALANEILLAKI